MKETSKSETKIIRGSPIWEIEIAPHAQKFLKSLDTKAQKQINAKIESLRDWPNSHADIVKLKDRLNIWRVRAGDYRAAFWVNKKERKIGVFKIDSRRDFYRR